MLVKKTWSKGEYGIISETYEGWFLFGFIPLYVKTYKR